VCNPDKGRLDKAQQDQAMLEVADEIMEEYADALRRLAQ
jgi:hypothetical protein